MNLAQFQIILQKINALDKNINMDGKISSIEKDLMKAYVSQLYEACVSDNTVDVKTDATKVETTVSTPPPVAETTPPVPEVSEPVAQTTVTPEEVTTSPTAPEPVQQVVETVATTMQSAPEVTPAPQAQNKLQDLNDRIAANTKTVADKLSTPQGTSLNDRLANTQSNKTFNDKFTDPEVASNKVESSPPKMVHIPESIKHLDNSNPQIKTAPKPAVTPSATVTPPPPPAPEPVVNSAPTISPMANAPSVNINEIHALFDDQHASEAAGKWGSTPIQDLSKSIGLNDKISMIKELFNDDHHAFNNSLSQLNGLGSFNEAKDYMMRNLITVFKWNEGKKLERAKQLINLVRRRYK